MPDSIGDSEMREGNDYWISMGPVMPSVRCTVVIPAYGAEQTLMRAAESALDQTLRDIEVIIVDDASPDGCWDLISGLLKTDKRVRAVRNKRNRGKSVSMNLALSEARGRWLAVLDADDWYHPDRLQVLIAEGERRHVDMVADNQFFYDARAEQLAGTAWPQGHACWTLSFDDFLLGSDAFENFNLGMLKPVIRTDFMRTVGLGYEARARHGEDFFHLLQFYLSGGSAAVCDAAYYYYTQPFGSISREWSHGERTRYDFRNSYEINQRYLQEAEHVLTSRQRRRLLARNDGLKVLESYFSAKDAAAEKRWLSVPLALARHPGSLLLLARRLLSRLLPDPEPGTIHRIASRARRRERAANALETSNENG